MGAIVIRVGSRQVAARLCACCIVDMYCHACEASKLILGASALALSHVERMSKVSLRC